MPPMINESSDFEKLAAAFGSITSINSMDDVLEAVGLAGLPVAQRYGIICGCITFFITISSVLALLIFGGTFKRLQEQSISGEATIPDAVTAREGRPLLLERLLDAQERMMANYPEKYKNRKPSSHLTPLAKLILNVAPKDENNCVPEGYEENYAYAYRRCQDKPGGMA